MDLGPRKCPHPHFGLHAVVLLLRIRQWMIPISFFMNPVFNCLWQGIRNRLTGISTICIDNVVALIDEVWGGFKNRNKTYALGMLAYGAFTILLGFSTQFILFAALMFCVSFFLPIVQTASMTMLQEKAAPEMQGRVFSLLNVMFSGFMPLGMGVFGPLADFVPIGFLMIGTGGIIALIGLIIPCSKAFCRDGMMTARDAESGGNVL